MVVEALRTVLPSCESSDRGNDQHVKLPLKMQQCPALLGSDQQLSDWTNDLLNRKEAMSSQCLAN